MNTNVFAIVDATRGCDYLENIRHGLGTTPQLSGFVLHRPADAWRVSSLRPLTAISDNNPCEVVREALLDKHPATTVAYIPCDGEFNLTALPNGFTGVTPLLPIIPVGSRENVAFPVSASGWVAPVEVALQLLAARQNPFQWNLPHLVAALEGGRWRWGASQIGLGETDRAEHPRTIRAEHPRTITTQSRILAVVPHYDCEEWLDQCLYSLVNQTRPPDNIVVVDDGSAEPPREIVGRFPEVTLLRTPMNIGPENILHEMIRTADYDAYMVQDADDWSAEDRLEHSLREAERTGAEIVGTQEFRLFAEEPKVVLQTYPLDVNRAISKRIEHCVCHGASLIARSLALRIGGFDGALSVAADTDFVLRASHAGRIVNLPGAYYYRRKRPNSRTSSISTGHGSERRAREKEIVFTRALRNCDLEKRGISPQLVPTEHSTKVELQHLLGPSLRLVTAARS